LFTNAAAAQDCKRVERSQEQQRIVKLEGKIRQRDDALAELMAKHIAPISFFASPRNSRFLSLLRIPFLFFSSQYLNRRNP